MQVTINNKTYDVPENSSISTVNGKLFVNGSPFEGPSEEPKFFEVIIVGNVTDLRIERGNVTVHGNVTQDVDAGGNVTCREVSGSVDAGGTVQCGNVGGDVDAGGSVTCQTVNGDVDAGGNVRGVGDKK